MNKTAKSSDCLQVSEENIHGTIDPFVTLCGILELENPSEDSLSDSLTKIVEGVFRRNLKRIRAIHLLIDGTDEFSSSAQEIMRNMLEDVVSLEFIISSDDEEEIEKLTERFFDFQWIQLKDDLEFYKAAGTDLTKGHLQLRASEIEHKSSEIVSKYSNDDFPFVTKGESAHSWIGKRRFEYLFDSLRSTQGNESVDFITRAYVEGSRRTHFNPQAILESLELKDDKHHGVDWHVNAYETFILAGLCMCWLMRDYLWNVPPSPAWDQINEEKLDAVEGTLFYYLENIMQLHTHK